MWTGKLGGVRAWGQRFDPGSGRAERPRGVTCLATHEAETFFCRPRPSRAHPSSLCSFHSHHPISMFMCVCAYVFFLFHISVLILTTCNSPNIPRLLLSQGLCSGCYICLGYLSPLHLCPTNMANFCSSSFKSQLACHFLWEALPDCHVQTFTITCSTLGPSGPPSPSGLTPRTLHSCKAGLMLIFS